MDLNRNQQSLVPRRIFSGNQWPRLGIIMTFIDAIKNCFVKYVHFSGRSTRSEYWYFFLFVVLLSSCMDIVDATISGETIWSYRGLYGPAQLIFQILIFLPVIAVSVRRLHDVNKSGWWILLSLTIIGLIPLLWWAIKLGDDGLNEYGEDPLEGDKRTFNKEIPRSVKYFFIPAGLLISLTLLIFGAMIWSGIILEARVYKGTELSQSHKVELINSGIINEDEKIKYFHHVGLFSITDYGYVLTNDKIVYYYKNDEGLLKTHKMLLKNVKKVELVKEGDWANDSLYKIIGNTNASYESFEIDLSVTSGGDVEFIKALKEKIN